MNIKNISYSSSWPIMFHWNDGNEEKQMSGEMYQFLQFFIVVFIWNKIHFHLILN